MSPVCRKTDSNATSLETLSRVAFHWAPVRDPVGGQPGNDQKQSLHFRCSKKKKKKGRRGIIHKIVSVCVKIKV